MEFTFLTIDQVSKCTGMSTKWLWSQCRIGAIPHHRFGRSYRFSEQDLLDLDAQTAVSPAARGEVDRLAPTGGRRHHD
jgi:excisionase family DNA binding protein